MSRWVFTVYVAVAAALMHVENSEVSPRVSVVVAVIQSPGPTVPVSDDPVSNAPSATVPNDPR